jgi:DNA-binding transcriptional MerR regulator
VTTVGCLTIFEVLDETGLPYSNVRELADRGLITSRSSGGAVLYDPADVAQLRSARRHFGLDGESIYPACHHQ